MDFVALLAEGVERWNGWRSHHPNIPCMLAGADLSNGYFFECDFKGVDLSGANLSRACLIGADFRWSNLAGTDFSGAYLSEANLSGARLSNTNFINANMEKTTLPNWHHIADKSDVLNLSPTGLESLHYRVVELEVQDGANLT